MIACAPDAPDQHRRIVSVGSVTGVTVAAQYPDLNAALEDIVSPTDILLASGEHVVDNPVILAVPNLRIVGVGRDSSSVVPRHSGREVFRIAASDVTIEAVTINGRSRDSGTRVTLGILLDRKTAGCVIRDVRIEDTGASAVLGHAVSDCEISGSEILGSGDDGLQLRGERLAIEQNVIIGYFDEGIDVAGDSMIVRNNHVASGRIGIVVDGSGTAVVDGNVIEDNSQEGMHVFSATGDGTVRNNRVKDATEVAYIIQRARDVSHNIALGDQRLGMRIVDASGSVFNRNGMVAAELGYELIRSAWSDAADNAYCGTGDTLHANPPTHVPIANDCLPFDSELQAESLGAGAVVHTERPSWPVKTSGASPADERIAGDIARFLERWNPGYLSLHVDGRRMRSEITPELLDVLNGGEDLVIGVVRWPIRMYHWRTSNGHPLWHLTVDDKTVAIVSYSDHGAGAGLRLLRSGRLSLADAISFRAERARVAMLEFYGRLRRRLTG